MPLQILVETYLRLSLFPFTYFPNPLTLVITLIRALSEYLPLSSFIIVVSQHYDTDGSKEYVIRGNSAIIKCQIPSFVADFVSVVSWHTDQDETFYADNKYGLFDAILQLLRTPFILT